MAKRSGGGAFFFGSVLGGVVGSLVALWTTPQSGQDLRRKLGLDQAASKASSVLPTSGSADGSDERATTGSSTPLSARLLSPIERVTAPLVGVKLGQTANNSQPGYTGPATPITGSAPAATASPVQPSPVPTTATGEVSSGLVPPVAGVPVMPSGSK